MHVNKVCISCFLTVSNDDVPIFQITAVINITLSLQHVNSSLNASLFHTADISDTANHTAFHSAAFHFISTALLLQQTRSSSRLPSEPNHNSYQDAVNLIKVTTNPPETSGQCWNISKNVMNKNWMCEKKWILTPLRVLSLHPVLRCNYI